MRKHLHPRAPRLLDYTTERVRAFPGETARRRVFGPDGRPLGYIAFIVRPGGPSVVTTGWVVPGDRRPLTTQAHAIKRLIERATLVDA